MHNLHAFILIAATSIASAQAAIPDGGWSVKPANGSTVEKITEISVSKQNEHNIDPYINRSVKINGESIAITSKATSDGGTIVMTLATPVEKSGEYLIVVPAGTFTYGFSFWGDEDDNPEISWSVTVDNPDQPIGPEIPEITIAADPVGASTVKSLDKITVTFEGAATASAAAGRQITVTSLGSPVETTATVQAGNQPNQAVINLAPAITTSGEYTVTVGEGSFDLVSDKGATFQNEEFKLNYTVKAPPAVGERFVVDNIRYKVLSRQPMTAEVTFPESESHYSTLTTVPTSVTYDGETFAVTAIGELAFSEVPGMEEFTVPEGITRIGKGAFWECSISGINIASTVTEIGESAFESCKSLTTFTLPATVTTLGDDILCDCAVLKTVNLPDNLTAIPAGFLRGCALLEKVDIPASVTKIGEFAMSECPMLSKTNIPEGVTEIGRFAYAYCTELTQLTVPETVTTMGHGVFYQAGLTEAALPQNITVIPDGTFQCCASLKEFTIGPNVTEIEKEAFFWCFALEKITFGEKTAVIGANAFEKDEALTEVVCLNPEPATGASFPQTVYDNARLVVPAGTSAAYAAAPGWKEFKNIIDPVGINVTETDGCDISFNGNTLCITAETDVTVTDISGIVLYHGKTGRVDLPAKGIYIVSANGNTRKIAR